MTHNPTTLVEFLVQEDTYLSGSNGSILSLFIHLEQAGKIIASHIKKAGLVDILGATGEINASRDEVKKIDVFSNSLLSQSLLTSGQVYAIASEEMEEFVFATEKNQGQYIVFFDPLDGSSNFETNITVGTIFSIYQKGDSLLQEGKKQIASGYILYGPSVMFVYATSRGVNGFTLDPAMGSFLLSHPNMKIPEEGIIYSMNEAYALSWHEHTQKYITFLKEENMQGNKTYKARYAGSMVADVHRILIQGGIFLHPGDKKHINGGLRLMYEVNPLSFLIEQAGGIACNEKGNNPLNAVPTSLHEKTPIVLGSKKNMHTYLSFQS